MPKQKLPLTYLALITQVGLSMLVPILLGLFIGQWLDRLIGSGGLVLILMLFLGIAAAFRNLLKLNTVARNLDKTRKRSTGTMPSQIIKPDLERLNPAQSARRGQDSAGTDNEMDSDGCKTEIEVEEW